MKTRVLALTLFGSLILPPSAASAQISVDVGVGHVFDGVHLGFSYHSYDGYESGYLDFGYGDHGYFHEPYADWYGHRYDAGLYFDPFCWDGYFRYHPRWGYGCYERDAFAFGISIGFRTHWYRPYHRY
ncbi:MAG: hypothetical protein ACOC5J_00585, partial [Gemmatimonadota bacterium]